MYEDKGTSKINLSNFQEPLDEQDLKDIATCGGVLTAKDDGLTKYFPEQGVKDDDGKLEYAKYLAHFPNALQGLVEVATYGGKKYKEKGVNWRAVANARKRYTEAMLRHILAYIFGEVNDKESGHPHLHHALWNICAVIELIKQEESK